MQQSNLEVGKKCTHCGYNKASTEELPFCTLEIKFKMSRLYLKRMKRIIFPCQRAIKTLQHRKMRIWSKTQAVSFCVDKNKHQDCFMDWKIFFRNYLAWLCCCWTEETNSDVKTTEISKFSSKFSPRQCNKQLFV